MDYSVKWSSTFYSSPVLPSSLSSHIHAAELTNFPSTQQPPSALCDELWLPRFPATSMAMLAKNEDGHSVISLEEWVHGEDAPKRWIWSSGYGIICVTVHLTYSWRSHALTMSRVASWALIKGSLLHIFKYNIEYIFGGSNQGAEFKEPFYNNCFQGGHSFIMFNLDKKTPLSTSQVFNFDYSRNLVTFPALKVNELFDSSLVKKFKWDFSFL